MVRGAQQPAQKRIQFSPAAHIRTFTRAARPALQAPVPLLTGSCFPVPNQPVTTNQTLQRYASTPATLSFKSLATPDLPRYHWEASPSHTHVLSYNPTLAPAREPDWGHPYPGVASVFRRRGRICASPTDPRRCGSELATAARRPPGALRPPAALRQLAAPRPRAPVLRGTQESRGGSGRPSWWT